MARSKEDTRLELAERVAARFAGRQEVTAVALGGSMAACAADSSSDIDLYVYTVRDVPLDVRAGIVEATGGASRVDLGLTYWGPGDEWYHAPSGVEVDIVYFDAAWMEGELRRVLVDAAPSLGYTTCFAHTIAASRPFHDPRGWLATQQALCARPYPESLREAIIAHNHPVLRGVIPSYRGQIEKAAGRGDAVSANHRVAALLASYFDILFAFNRVYHPGEKRLIEKALALCPRLPEGMEGDLAALMAESGAPSPALLSHLDRLLDRLDDLLDQNL